jgi:hypothetical protein
MRWRRGGRTGEELAGCGIREGETKRNMTAILTGEKTLKMLQLPCSYQQTMSPFTIQVLKK